MIFDTFSLEKQRLGIKKILKSCQSKVAPHCEVHVAILENKGDLIDVIGSNPLHFAGLEATVKAAKLYLTPKNGETLITNDPYSGNPRMCDLVLIQGAYGRLQANELRYFVAIQLSLPQLLNKGALKLFSSVEDEGFRIPPTPLEQNGKINPEIVQYLCQSKIDFDSLTDILNKAREALKIAAQDLIAIETKIGRENFAKSLEQLKDYSEKMMRKALHEIPDGEYSAHETIESDGFGANNLRVQCKLMVQGENILVSFLGTSKQTKGPYNCGTVMALGACFWMFRSLLKVEIPINAGVFKAFSVEAPEGTLVNAKYPAPLLGGYYETTKRIVDILYLILNKALPSEIPAQNGGSTSICFLKAGDKLFTEVLGNGGGATKGRGGADGTLTDLHNSPLLSVEDIENRYPLQVLQSSLREGSGGEGRQKGGDGVIRKYKFLSPGQALCLSDRRLAHSRGLFGGGSGARCEIILDKKIDGKIILDISEGNVLTINTPGGGGWGKKPEPEVEPEVIQ